MGAYAPAEALQHDEERLLGLGEVLRSAEDHRGEPRLVHLLIVADGGDRVRIHCRTASRFNVSWLHVQPFAAGVSMLVLTRPPTRTVCCQRSGESGDKCVCGCCRTHADVECVLVRQRVAAAEGHCHRVVRVELLHERIDLLQHRRRDVRAARLILVPATVSVLSAGLSRRFCLWRTAM